MPTLAQTIVKNGGVENFRGLAVGNPITWMPYRNYGQLATFAGHQTVPKPVWDRFHEIGCHKVTTPDYSGECATINDKIMELNAGFDPYALDFPLCQEDSSKSDGRDERYTLLKHITKARKQSAAVENVSFRGWSSMEVKYGDNDPSYFPKDYTPCEQDFTVDYLNRDDVQAALHINTEALGEDFTWSGCSGSVDYSIDDVNAPMMPIWEFLTSCGKDLNMMIYSGDDDTICATAGTQQFLWDMNWDIEEEWAPWEVVEDQIGGYHVLFNNPRDKTGKGRLHFSTVHGAGHMVPSTRPEQASELMQRFLKGEL
jgi:carboxypeptidase C (cathepsin A)